MLVYVCVCHLCTTECIQRLLIHLIGPKLVKKWEKWSNECYIEASVISVTYV